jgi:hypothetical protein
MNSRRVYSLMISSESACALKDWRETWQGAAMFESGEQNLTLGAESDRVRQLT